MLYVVTGPPAAGKSSWIKAHAKPTDIVIDLDLMALAMAGPGADHHAHGDILMRVVHRARFAALNEAYQHLDKVDVYVIHTQPSTKTLAKYKRLEARLVTVAPAGRSSWRESRRCDSRRWNGSSAAGTTAGADSHTVRCRNGRGRGDHRPRIGAGRFFEASSSDPKCSSRWVFCVAILKAANPLKRGLAI
ncbi:hypothetical protein [Streptomyces sp. NPDC058066]|uniref:hypothetical protein n=1 Tax=Streptomyces sp. NPDC058066 TaxID=3346323 RepID=UPI0036ED10EF